MVPGTGRFQAASPCCRQFEPENTRALLPTVKDTDEFMRRARTAARTPGSHHVIEGVYDLPERGWLD